ncbi:hypothetical protein [Caulobacter sp. FWC2]|uniref:hypothetical protein n=1 Tax=Caulobacter sp. FWC2 TaxID=69664 RepID=UPI000C15AC5A|nr:hypothetical protein [Caulobacter sp. FWC2]PIB92200.1 hypothetical protein CSW62_11850 [Caulobacter sp. FWC2]
MRSWAVGLVLAAMVPMAAVAQDAPPLVSDTLVVKSANRARTMNYVRAATELSNGMVSRRSPQLCPVVAGAGKIVDDYVRSRLRQIAGDVGLRFETQKCYPNLMILFSREPELMLDQARRRGKIRYDTISLPRIDRFKANTNPVRWLSYTGEVPAYGDISSGDTDIRAMRAPDSHILQPVASRLHYSLVVVDARKTDGVEIGALADYVSLVALADIRPDATQPDQASILNLFVEPGGPKRMTASDKAYLRGLYKLKTDRIGPDQLGALTSAMATELER